MRVLPLDDTAAALETVGGKGASLARLARAGLPVPDGFHVTTDAYREFVAPFRDRILAALDEPAKIAELFARHEMPEQSARAVMTAYQALGDDVPVAVRRSGPCPWKGAGCPCSTRLRPYGWPGSATASSACTARRWTWRGRHS